MRQPEEETAKLIFKNKYFEIDHFICIENEQTIMRKCRLSPNTKTKQLDIRVIVDAAKLDKTSIVLIRKLDSFWDFCWSVHFRSSVLWVLDRCLDKTNMSNESFQRRRDKFRFGCWYRDVILPIHFNAVERWKINSLCLKAEKTT